MILQFKMSKITMAILYVGVILASENILRTELFVWRNVKSAAIANWP